MASGQCTRRIARHATMVRASHAAHVLNNASEFRPTVLLGGRLPDMLVAELTSRYDVVGPLPAPFETGVVRSLAPDVAARVRAIVTMGTVATTAAALDRLPALGLVACMGSGYEGVDRCRCAERGIVVTHSPGANADSVADVALGLLLASVRRFSAGACLIRNGAWRGNAAQRTAPPRGMTGRKVGIYGLGAIGTRIARRVVACEAEIGYHNRRRRDDVPYRWFGSLADLAAWADALVVAVRADAANRHAVDAAILRALGPEGHIVNIARGSVIDEAALIEALQSGVIAGAGLDVYENEPDVPRALVELPNVVLMPHIGGATVEAQLAMNAMVLGNLAAFFAGQGALTPVPLA
jgi:lactate dehydrogenase-like 2-hydroxyacid dehydrogenase